MGNLLEAVVSKSMKLGTEIVDPFALQGNLLEAVVSKSMKLVTEIIDPFALHKNWPV